MTLQLQVDSLAAEVGGAFTGQLVRQADADGASNASKAREIRVQLLLRTEGRGTTDEAVVSSLTQPLQRYGGINAPFTLGVPPRSAVSYDGSLIRVLYRIEARVDLRLSRDIIVYRNVLVVPVGGLGMYTRAHPLPRPPQASAGGPAADG